MLKKYIIIFLFYFPFASAHLKQEDMNVQQALLAANYTKSHSRKDASIRIIDVESVDNTLYLTLQSSLSESEAALSYGFVKAYCFDHQTRGFLNVGINYYFFVFDELHSLIAEFSIEKNKCNEVSNKK